ncbi:hypothetical protein [Paenarthrobacter sp. C1]|uniref:hypothetical protein n=1 Tax=Paenarthrobacter sp. C1 TaxID=3400220 RepID=UPI003BF57F32
MRIVDDNLIRTAIEGARDCGVRLKRHQFLRARIAMAATGHLVIRRDASDALHVARDEYFEVHEVSFECGAWGAPTGLRL